MTRGRGFSSYRGSRSSWNDHASSAYNSSHSSVPRFPSFSSSLDSRSRYPSAGDRYGGSARSPYDDYHKSYRSELSGGYSGRDAHRSPERKRLRDEAPRRSREVDSFSSSASRYAPSFMDRSFRDRRPPPPPTISRREEFRRPLPPPSPRGGYRGRLSSRGIRGVRLRDGPPRRRLVESSYAIRRRLPPLLSSDYTRRLKVSRLRSAIARRAAIKRKRVVSDNDDSDEEKKSDSEKEKKEKEKKEDSDAEGNEEKKDKEETPKKKEDKEKGEEGDKEVKSSPKKDFIKLVCPHCNSKYLTFGKYSAHLHSSKHMGAMRQVALKQKTILGRMRLSQRNAQRELEKSAEDLAPRTNFCPLCKLNYKQPKATHQASDTHKTMKKFLMPYCKICRITFKSPMIYETHICSIDHIKRKARTEINGEKSDNDSEDLLEHFMTIDSVGDVDDGIDVKKKDKEKSESDGKTKIPVNVGIEQIKKVEVHYCELCRMYLPRVAEDELEKTLSKHCKQRTHLQRYIRYKEDKEIANRAERLQRKETAEKEREKKIKEEPKNEDGKKEDAQENEEKDKIDEDETMDDKLWADDVNKDLGDILAEAESGNKSSDDEGGERFDRFGTSEKNGEEMKGDQEENDAKKEDVNNSIENK